MVAFIKRHIRNNYQINQTFNLILNDAKIFYSIFRYIIIIRCYY